MHGWGAGEIEAVVHRVVGRSGCRVASMDEERVPVENFTTEALVRLRGELDDGEPWSLVAKVLRPASASPMWVKVPVELHAAVLGDLNWLDEPRVYQSTLASETGARLRFPELFGVDENSDRIVLWLEDVPDTTPWDLDRYRRTAAGLGELGARWPEERAADALGSGRRSIERLFFGKVQHNDLAIQAEDAFWQRPDVEAVVDSSHRADLSSLAAHTPPRLQRLGTMSHPLAHGDATPDNFHEPGDGTIVALDWSYAAPSPAGSDLGQLMAGRVESGAATGLDFDELAAAVVDGYIEGLSNGSADVPGKEAIEEALLTYLAVRSTFSALLLDPVDPDDAGGVARLRERARLARWTMDRVLSS